MLTIQQSSSGTNLPFFMVLSSDHITPATGLSPTVTLSKNCGSFASPIGTVGEIGNGWYKITGTGLTTDTNTLGALIIHASGTAADFTDMPAFNIVAYNPQDSTRLGLTQIPTGTIPTVGTGSNQISLTNGQTIIQSGTGAGQLDFTNGVIKGNLTQVTGVSVNNTVAQLGVNIVNIGGTTTAGSAGYVGIDLGHVNAPGSTLALTGITIGSVNLINPSGITNNSFVSPNVTGVATGFIDRHDQVWRRFFKKTDKSTTNIHTYADDGTTILTTQSYTESTTDTVNAAT